MFIQTEPMPDPDEMKFLPGRDVLGAGMRGFSNPDEAAASPLARRLFSVSGVRRVVLGSDHVVVTRDETAWQHLKPALLGAIMEHFLSGAPAVEAGAMDHRDDGEMIAVIRDSLRGVIDPELGCNIVDLGLVYAVSLDLAGTAHILMTTTTPGCPATSYLRQGAREAALSVAGVSDVEVTLTYDPRWSTARMSAAIKAQFGVA